MANWFLGRALAEEAEAKNAAWSFLGEGVTFWVTVAVLLVVGVAVYLVTRKKSNKKSFWTAKTMAVGAMCMALSSVLSLIKLWPMPMGGSVTPASMLPLLLFAYCYGVGPGMVLGALYGVMQFLLDGMAWAALGAIEPAGLPDCIRTAGAGGLLPRQQGEDDGGLRAGLLRAVYGVVPLRLHLLWAVRAGGRESRLVLADLQRQLHARRVHHLHRAGAAGRGAAGEGTQESRMTNFLGRCSGGFFRALIQQDFAPPAAKSTGGKRMGRLTRMIDLCTLGTGGTMPLPDRALASLYVRVGGRAVLVDCGEGTQIGIQRLSWGIQCIDAILLTHYHADHCSGLPGMLLAITKAGRTAPLHIYGPIGLERIVSGLRVIAPSLSCPIVLHEIIDDYSPFAAVGLTITPFPLRHEMPCIGYQFHLPRPALFDPIRARAQEIPVKLWSILQRGETVSMDGQTYYPHQVLGQPRRGITFVYATDTRPVPGIVRMGQDSDLMILEGMYGAEEKLPLAHKNCHMLFREAAQLARDAGTKRLLLTHFSTSIESPEEFLPNAQAVFPETTCATDGMTLTLRYPEEA